MIVDCHHHIFRPWATPCGHSSRAIHMKYMQKMLTRTSAECFRIRDGVPGDPAVMYRAGDESWSGLVDVNFRVGKFGRLELTHEGEDYAIQFMPLGMQEMEAPPELAVAQMGYAGVDHTILHGGGAYGAISDYNAYAQAQFAGRFTGLMWVDEGRAGAPENLAEIDRAYHALGLRGIYFNTEAFARHGFTKPLDDESLLPFWEKLDGLGVVVCIEIWPYPTYDAAAYAGHMVALGRLIDRFPGLRWHLAMGLNHKVFQKGGKWVVPDEIAAVYRRERLWVEVTLPISFGGAWDYPFPEAQALIRDFRDTYGAEKMIWGSDMPNIERYCTYRQSLDYVGRYCEFLKSREKDLILGDNAAELYGLG